MNCLSIKLNLINLQEFCYIWLYSGEFKSSIYSDKLTAQIMLLQQTCILYNIMRIEIMLVSINYDMIGCMCASLALIKTI